MANERVGSMTTITGEVTRRVNKAHRTVVDNSVAVIAATTGRVDLAPTTTPQSNPPKPQRRAA